MDVPYILYKIFKYFNIRYRSYHINKSQRLK